MKQLNYNPTMSEEWTDSKGKPLKLEKCLQLITEELPSDFIHTHGFPPPRSLIDGWYRRMKQAYFKGTITNVSQD